MQSEHKKTVNVWADSLNDACREVGECLKAMKDKSSTNNMYKEKKNTEFVPFYFVQN